MRYVPELDGLRAVAVIAVILFHSAGSLFRGGFLGVDLFFVLSAFLITSILAREWEAKGKLDLKDFYWRRLLRLMPPLLLMLATYAVMAPFIWPGHNHAADALLAALYVSDYTVPLWGAPAFLQHTWSLGVEEKFYLLWPLLLIPLLKAKNPTPWLIGAYIACLLWRETFDFWRDYYFRFDTRASGLILGALLFFWLPRLRLAWWISPVAAGAFIAVCLLGTISRAAGFIPLAEIASAALIACAATGNSGALGSLLRSPLMVWIGKLSYGIYLWHVPIAVIIRDDLGFAATACITFIGSTALAALSYVTVEAWARKVRRVPRQEGLAAA